MLSIFIANKPVRFDKKYFRCQANSSFARKWSYDVRINEAHAYDLIGEIVSQN